MGVATERSVGELFSDLASETGTLLRQEVKLATVELTQKATYAGKQTATVAIGSLLGICALQTLLAAAVLALGVVLPLPLAAVIVGVIVSVAAFVVVRKGIVAFREMNPKLTQTILSLEENKSWAKEQIR